LRSVQAPPLLSVAPACRGARVYQLVLSLEQICTTPSHPNSEVEVVALALVQLAMPAGGQAPARAFLTGLRCIPEVPKPPRLACRGPASLKRVRVTVPLGVEKQFRAARKVHPARLMRDLQVLIARSRQCVVSLLEDHRLPSFGRICVADPFANRIALLQAGPADR
jgi:hypothetical protein